MRISDWSSDVCSSDLPDRLAEMAPGFPDDEDRLVGGLEAQCRHFPVIGEQPYAADRGRRQNGRSAPRRLALVIERDVAGHDRSEEHTSELQSLMRISYAVFCLKKKKNK